jgi:uncharacterized protein (TIGR00255 family)
MITSMTGFGRGAAQGQGARAEVELRSVNSRFLDVQVRCASSIQEFEPAIRERLQARLGRGKISGQVSWEEEVRESRLPRLDEEVAGAYLEGLERLRGLGLVDGRIELALLAGLPGVFRAEEAIPEPEQARDLILRAVDGALDELLAMRRAEGEALGQDMRQRVGLIEERLRRIEELAPLALEQARGRLRERVEALLRPGEVEESRLALEVVLLAERSDIAEEIVRFHSHNAQFVEALERGGEIGRRCNFLLQEMNREANTISSKATDARIVHQVVDIKEEVERLREQVQNLA